MSGLHEPAQAESGATKPVFAQRIEEDLCNPPYWWGRADAASEYAAGMQYALSDIDWKRVNAALIERWSESGLAWIKRKAWKMNEALRHG